MTDDLSTLLADLPDDALLPVGWIRARLRAPVAPKSDGLADLSCDVVAKQLGRKPGTIRGWCARGEIEGAYRLNDREWRIPAASLRAYLDKAAERKDPRNGAAPDLGSWRRIKR